MWTTFINVKEKDKQKFENIPHGSGIDYQWWIVNYKNYFNCSNSYHCMNEDGYYSGIAKFSLIIPKKDPNDFKLHFHGSYSQYLNKRYLLREYLEELFAYWIDETFKKEKLDGIDTFRKRSN